MAEFEIEKIMSIESRDQIKHDALVSNSLLSTYFSFQQVSFQQLLLGMAIHFAIYNVLKKTPRTESDRNMTEVLDGRTTRV